MAKKKALFIIQSYPSNRSANVLCDEKIMKAMSQTGEWEVHCLAYQFHGQALFEELNGFKVHRFKRGIWWDLYNYARDNESRWQYRMIVKLDRLYMRLRQLFFIPIYPNYEPLLAKVAAKEAIKLHSRENYDLVIAEHSGRDTLYAGMRLKQFDPAVKFVAILWDPLSGRTLAKYLPEKFARLHAEKDEAHLLNNSDYVICLESNREFQEKYSAHKPFFSRVRFLDIPGIIRPAISGVDEQFTQKGKINILYSGILSLPDRDPSPLIELLNMSEYAERIHLMFFSIGIEAIDKAKKKLANFKGTYLIHPYVAKATLDSIAAKSDILINLGGPNPRMVPSKIFEYMSLGKPIISTYYIDNESSKQYFSRYPLATCIDVRKELVDNVRQLDGFIAAALGSAVAFDDVRSLFPLNTPQEYVKLFESMV